MISKQCSQVRRKVRRPLERLESWLLWEIHLVVCHKLCHITFSAELFLFFACLLKLLLYFFSQYLLWDSLIELFLDILLLLLLLKEVWAIVLDDRRDLGAFFVENGKLWLWRSEIIFKTFSQQLTTGSSTYVWLIIKLRMQIKAMIPHWKVYAASFFVDFV